VKVGDLLALLAAAAFMYSSLVVIAYGVPSLLLRRGCYIVARAETCQIDVVVPVYSEPLENVVESVASVAGFANKIFVVWDGELPPKAGDVLKGVCGEKLVLVHRRERRGKGSALNEALRLSSADYLFLLDAGDVVKGDASQLCGCCSVITRWKPKSSEPGLREAIAAATVFLASLLYRGRCLLGHFVVFLGTGSSVERGLAIKLGGWRSNAVLEDVEFGFRLASSRCRPCYTEDVETLVETPPSYLGLRVQQQRWMRGVGQLIARRWWRDVGQLAYLLIYPAAAIWHPLILVSAALGVSKTLATVLLVSLAACTLASSLIYVRFLELNGYGWVKAVRLAGASSALGLVLAPSLVIAFIEGVLGVKGWGQPTPRRRGVGSWRSLVVELLYALASTAIALTCSWQLALIAALYPIAFTYILVRFGGEIA
jgi:cellulose synthase/poly-beta-1,6-N-acetylglucosamine synthase-like glycosyltransferase